MLSNYFWFEPGRMNWKVSVNRQGLVWVISHRRFKAGTVEPCHWSEVLDVTKHQKWRRFDKFRLLITTKLVSKISKKKITSTKITKYFTIIYILCVSVCLFVCIQWTSKWLNRSGPNFWWDLMDNNNSKNLSPTKLDFL